MKKVLFINTFHNSTDDRTFYHQAKSLAKNGVETLIFSSFEDNNSSTESGIRFCSRKINTLTFLDQIKELKACIHTQQPDVVICDSPTGILAASMARISTRRIYDITEWIPSKKHLRNTGIYVRPVKFVILLFVNLLAGALSHRLIFGEYYKTLLFRPLFWKNKKIISYFPSLDYIPTTAPRSINAHFCMNYSGWFNKDKGFDKVIEVTGMVAALHPETKITLRLTGRYENSMGEKLFEKQLSELPENVTIEKTDFLPFPAFCQSLSSADIFLDLRLNDFENTHCLPIKLFYYLACGRPVVFNSLKAINHEVDINNSGIFMENNDLKAVSHRISEYISKPELYKQHCRNALKLATENYNWEKISDDFVRFVLK